MSLRRGWWELKISNITCGDNEIKELNECDLEHIAKCIKEDYTQGEVLQEDSEEEVENEKVKNTPLKELPLLIGSLEYDSSTEILEERLKNES